MSDQVTHRCTGHVYSDDAGYLGPQERCPAYRTADGKYHDTCGEPCSWIMMKSGHGEPAWTQADREREIGR